MFPNCAAKNYGKGRWVSYRNGKIIIGEGNDKGGEERGVPKSIYLRRSFVQCRVPSWVLLRMRRSAFPTHNRSELTINTIIFKTQFLTLLLTTWWMPEQCRQMHAPVVKIEISQQSYSTVEDQMKNCSSLQHRDIIRKRSEAKRRDSKPP